MKSILLLLLVFTISNLKAEPLQGQAKLDSLLAELPNAKGDTNEVNLLSNISSSYYSTNPDKGIEYGTRGLELSRKINWKLGEAKCNNLLGQCYSTEKNNNPKALEYFFKALKLNEEIGAKNNKAITLGNIGRVYFHQLKYSKALKYLQSALLIYEEIGNKSGISLTFGNIGTSYGSLSNYPKSLEYLHKALVLNTEIGNKSEIAMNLTNLGRLYLEINDFNKSLVYLKQAFELCTKIGNKHCLTYVLFNFSYNYQKQAEQIELLNGDDKISLITAKLKKENLYKESLQFGLQAEKIADSNKIADAKYNIYNTISKSYKNLNQPWKALEYFEKYTSLKDSIFSQKNTDKIAALEKAREDDLKQKEIEKQKIRIAEQEKREQLILYFSIGFFIVMAIVMLVIYRLLKRSDKLLYNVLPVSIAKRLKKKEHPISDHFIQASIIFIDIVNFTEMAKDEDPQRLVSNLNTIFTKYDTIANKYGLEKIKTIGDSYMAAAGIPEVQEDNTHRAAQMALEVKAMMCDYHTADGTKIEVRIGLDCGPVVAGVIGENKFIYDMWSDAVNTASRMESSSIAGEVHVSERFKEAVTEYEQFDYVERGEMEIKGKGKMKTFFMGSKAVEGL